MIWRPMSTAKQDGKRILAWAKLTCDEYDEDYCDGRVPIRRNVVSYYATTLDSWPPFEGWVEPGNRLVRNVEYVAWQPITGPTNAELAALAKLEKANG